MSAVARPGPAAAPRQASDAAAVYADTKCFQVESAVVAMAVSYNSTVWLAMQDGRVEVRDVHTGQVVHTFATTTTRQRRSRVWSLLSVYDVVHKEAQLWMGLSTGAIEVYTETYQLRRQLSKHLSGIYCLTQYRGTVAYAGSSDFTITQWRVADGQLLRVLTGHSNYVRCLYAESSALVSGSDDNTVRVWDTASGAALQQHPHLHRDSGGVLALCRVGTLMWSGDHSGAIAVWRLKDGEALLVLRQLQSRVTSLRKVGSRVYAGGAEGRIYVFNAGDCSIVNRLDDHLGSGVSAIACAVEVNRYDVWSCSADNTVRCWHHDEHQPMTAEREAFLDMRWYYTTQLPYLQANEALLEQQRELAELVVLSSGSDEAVRAFLSSQGEGRETAAARYWLLDGKVKQTQKRLDAVEEETRSIDAAMDRKAQTLSVLRAQLTRLTEALNTARNRGTAPPPAVAVPVPGLVPLPGGIPPPPTVVVPGAVPPPLPLSAAAAAGPLAPLSPPPPGGPSVLSPLPPSPPGAASLPRPLTFVSALSTGPGESASTPLPPPPPPPIVQVPPPPVVPVPERTSPQVRITTETHVTLSRSYEPVLTSLPPPPSAAGPKPTMGALLRLASGGGTGTAPAPPPPPPPPPASVPVPVPPPPVVAVPVPPSTAARTLDELPVRASPPLTRRMSF